MRQLKGDLTILVRTLLYEMKNIFRPIGWFKWKLVSYQKFFKKMEISKIWQTTKFYNSNYYRLNTTNYARQKT